MNNWHYYCCFEENTIADALKSIAYSWSSTVLQPDTRVHGHMDGWTEDQSSDYIKVCVETRQFQLEGDDVHQLESQWTELCHERRSVRSFCYIPIHDMEWRCLRWRWLRPGVSRQSDTYVSTLWTWFITIDSELEMLGVPEGFTPHFLSWPPLLHAGN